MKAIIYTGYRPVKELEYKEVDKPVPKDDEVLVKIHAASLNAADWHLVKGEPVIVRFWSGLTKPKHQIPGSDFAGTVEAAGSGVKEFKPGDEVFGDLSSSGWGSFAEYVCVKEKDLVTKPKKMSFDEAACLPMAGCTALQSLRDKCKIKKGQKVLINGASGGVGTFAVQIAKAYNTKVTAVCSTEKVEMVKKLGADFVIDYKKEDFTKSRKKYDLILAVNGNLSVSEYKRVMSSKGVYMASGGSSKQIFQAMLLGSFASRGGKKVSNIYASPNKKDIKHLADLYEAGKVKPVISKTYKLSQVPEALSYLEEGHAAGKVVIKIVSGTKKTVRRRGK